MTATISAPVKRFKAVSNSVAYGNALVCVLLDAEDTRGSFSLLEIEARPGTEPPYHVHERADETFYLLDGRVSFMVDGKVYDVVPGETLFLPRLVPHTFRIRSASARALLTVTPSGFENYFRTLGQAAGSLSIPKPAPPPPNFFQKLAQTTAKLGVRNLENQPVF
jgi:quercetin dioxygenase-like cupin family protein